MTYKALEHLLILRSNWSSQIYWGFRHMEGILDLCPFAYLVAQGLSFIAIKIQCTLIFLFDWFHFHHQWLFFPQ
jgi:hypothetical protein